MSPHEIDNLKKLLRRLGEEDKNLRISGASGHNYKLGPTLSERELQEFEQRHQVKLPEDYRFFLKEIGNGGAGPYYGLVTLEEAARFRNISKPFLLTVPTESLTNEELDKYGDRDEYPGILEICHFGCGIYYYLVVNGPTYGSIWNGREDFYPTGLTFNTWYQQWIREMEEKALPILAKEDAAKQIKVGMTKQEAIDALGSEGRIREVFGTNRRLLGFDGLATEFELNEDDMVTERREWPIIPSSF